MGRGVAAAAVVAVLGIAAYLLWWIDRAQSDYYHRIDPVLRSLQHQEHGMGWLMFLQFCCLLLLVVIAFRKV